MPSLLKVIATPLVHREPISRQKATTGACDSTHTPASFSEDQSQLRQRENKKSAKEERRERPGQKRQSKHALKEAKWAPGRMLGTSQLNLNGSP